ncbi:MAG: hypothetical protein COA43_02900 [Robiginitomaculum sp.]|nr:MAG: hypothetical protein COA43_02900 [Robiginitomaculum sp.]
MPSSEQVDKSQRLQADLRDKCCEASIFSGFLTFVSAYQAYKFNSHKNDIANGLAVFVFFIASIFVFPFLFANEIKNEPLIWLAFLVCMPLIIVVYFAEQTIQNIQKVSHED